MSAITTAFEGAVDDIGDMLGALVLPVLGIAILPLGLRIGFNLIRSFVR